MTRRLELFSRSTVWVGMAALMAGGIACRDKGSYPTRDGETTLRPRSAGGAVQITASRNTCPAVTFGVAPPDAKVGERMDVNATVVDPDSGDPISYFWTAGAGSFADSKAAHTAYTCSVDGAGPQTIVLFVSDGSCTVTQSASVYCYATGARMGTGGAMAGPGIGGASGTPATGVVDPARDNGVAGSAGHTSGSGGASGTGGAGSGLGTVAPACVHDPTHDEGAACESCTKDNCVPATDGCDGLPSDAKVAACQGLYCCLRGRGCAVDPIRGALECWCGTADNGVCWTNSAAANGACLREIREAADSTDAATIKQRFVDPSFALGRAINLATCRASYCNAPVSPADPAVPACRL